MIRRSLFMVTFTLLFGVTPVIAAPRRVQEMRLETEASRGAAREEMKAKSGAMRDGGKKQSVDRVQTKISDINTRRTDHFLKVLERLSMILDKIASRSEKAKTEGKNVSSTETAIASASAAISSAESAVNAQKAKTYQITVTDDMTARNDVGTTTKQLQDDLRAVQETVKAARNAVHNVLKNIKTVIGSSKGTTPSATDSSVTK